MHNAQRGILAIIICAVLWSTGGLFIKLVEWHPLAIAGIRSVFSCLFILIYLRKPHFTFSPPQIGAAICNAATMVFFVLATKMTTAANAILLQYIAPALVAFMSWWLLRERPSRGNWIAVVLVSGGMVLFFLDDLTPGSMAGNLFGLASGVTFASYSVFMRMQKAGSPLESIFLAHLLTACIGIPFYFTSAVPAPSAWVAMAFLGLFQVGLSSVFFSFSIKHVPAVQVMLIAVLEPILNPVWVFLATGEVPGPWAIGGGFVIVSAVTVSSVLSARSRMREAASQQDTE